ncbi:MAG: trypsin-like serine protease [Myxococcales bacterium]|jgi:hypothetical protein|nr:trypsin-like serine protease [Myxococcales bacterium]
MLFPKLGTSSSPTSPPVLLALALVSSLALLGGGCVRRPEVHVAQTMKMLEGASSGVVAVATALDDNPSHVTLCSGALVAPNLVLTARHCVSRAVTATPSCDAKGNSHNGAHLAEDADPQMITIYTGEHVRPEVDAPSAHAVQTLHPAGSVLCDADVAFLVLDRPVYNASIIPMRLQAPVESGDVVVPVGFGGGRENAVGHKVARPMGTVLSIGPASNSDTGAVLGPREFEVDHATCRGDSGGPALDARTGEIVGVVSRGGSCTARGNHVYTRIDAYQRLATTAIAAAVRANQEMAVRTTR